MATASSRTLKPIPGRTPAAQPLLGASSASAYYKPGGANQAGLAMPRAAAAPAAAAALPAPPKASTFAQGSVGSSVPPELTNLEIQGQADPRLTAYADRFTKNLEDIDKGKTREAEVFTGKMDSDMERQIAQAKESALAAGGNWTAEDENRMRTELKRGQYGALAEFELGSQRQESEALIGGLDTQKAPFQSQMAEKGLSQGTQKMLMDYAVQRGGLINEDKRTAVMEAGQAIDAYSAFLRMLSGGGNSFSFDSSF